LSTTVSVDGWPYLLMRLWQHLSRRRKFQFISLFALMLIGAVAEVVSLGAVLPFLGVLTNPEKVFQNEIVVEIAGYLGIGSANELMMPVTIIFIAAAIVAGAIRMLLLWVSTRLAFASGADISLNVYNRTLYQPYQVHTARNSSEVISGIINKVSSTTSILIALLTLIMSLVMLVAIMSALMVIDATVATVAIVCFGSCYGVITLMFRRHLKRNSQLIAFKQSQVVKVLQEGLGGVRDVLLDGSQAVYCDAYRNADLPLRRASAINAFMGQSPRYVMEALGMVLIALLAYYLAGQGGSEALPVLGALAMGAQRLLPMLQQSFASWSIIVGNHASLSYTLELLDQPMPEMSEGIESLALSFEDSICFENVSFCYRKNTPWILNQLNLTIPKGARVGIVGNTGCGKSTMLDLLMGLLEPTTGQVLVDGSPVTGSVRQAWQKNIAHVPQSIYLADSTVLENIALSIPLDMIDMERVRLAAEQAQIADFIEAMERGYDTSVGERGVCLSGGQRQRIGIARALYKRAKVLIFDEATSALDGDTENGVMHAIESLGRDLTILIVAHRLTTLQGCDLIIELKGGQVVAQGTYEQLFESSRSFRMMAQSVT